MKQFIFFLFDNRRRSFAEIQDGTVIGRTEGGLQYPEDPFLSRKHCRFSVTGNEAYIQDFDSTNQTKVNSVPIRAGYKRRIRLNDVLEMGGQRFILTHSGARNPNHFQNIPKGTASKRYRGIKNDDGSLSVQLTRAITQRTHVQLNWAEYQKLRWKKALKPAPKSSKWRVLGAIVACVLVGAWMFLVH